MSTTVERVDYPEILRTLGAFIQQEHLSEVCITEFDRGWVIVGLTFKSTGQGFIRVPADFVLSHDDVRKLALKLREQRKAESNKRRWLR